MIIFPSIDLKDGLCVRLYKGEFDTVEKVAADPIETAKEFKQKGAKHLHVVDLDGAKNGIRKNASLIKKIVNVFDGFVEVGGGVRNLQAVSELEDIGVDRIILGSAAFNNRELLDKLAFIYGDKIAVGIDAKDEMVSIYGWTGATDTNYIDFAKECDKLGINNIIFTDIKKDGTLEGPNLEQLARLQSAVKCKVTASGGIKDINDLINLKKMDIYAVICGKSIYSGSLKLEDALGLENKC